MAQQLELDFDRSAWHTIDIRLALDAANKEYPDETKELDPCIEYSSEFKILRKSESSAS